ncbi:hypothetical protein [Rhizobium sp. PL01]|uniref:hypothetical protein n=1 Tax=Rhizobium sp. PL01 TaxID=3085631 RepID=UPI002981A951|nr:hypothetical protein [Rhizobium sp. PL01]MDW5318241.1 hypothetical protein [Rhizobium sp. PL01]
MTASNSPFAAAYFLAKRLVSIGINPFQSDAERYVVLLGDGGGEIIDWGRPLRGTRYFGPNAIRKDRPMVDSFQSFAKQYGLHDCVFWGVGLTGAKAEPDHLNAALKSFNRKINVEFSELRKSGAFELLLLVIHPRYDEVSGLFDLHAHFIAKVPLEHREAVKHRLRVKFSKFHLPDNPIRNAPAAVTYMLWGIFRNKIMIRWPDHALKAAWKLTESRFRFVRTGGRFAKWKASKTPSRDGAVATMDQAQKSINRAESADPRQKVVNGDRLLSKIMLKIRGVRTSALLFEAAPKARAVAVSSHQRIVSQDVV